MAPRVLYRPAMSPRHSAKVPLLATLAGLLFALPVGCDEEPPIERRLCERFDSCNFFGPGVDVDDCTDVMTMCTGDLVSSVRSDWERGAERALENANCVNFLADYQDSDVCYIADDGSIADAPDPANDDGPAPQESCGEDYTACTGPNSIEACLDGQYLALSCDEVCDEGEVADGCAFDDELGRDVCYCVVQDEPTGPAPAPGG
jgi:hypothetical protein